MNNRLQVGGLALIIKGCKYTGDKDVGKTVGLIDFIQTGEVFAFLVKGSLTSYFWCDANRLIPLGDQQAQDELAKERENELN